MSDEHIGARIKRYRGNMSASELAKQTGVPRITRSVIANIESGRKSDPTISDLVNIAHVLRVPLAALVVDIRNPYGRVDLDDVGVPILAMQNIQLLQGMLSTSGETSYPDDTTARAIFGGLSALEDLDADIHEQELATRDRGYVLTDPDLDAVARAEFEDALDYARRELARLKQRRDATEGMLKALGVTVDR